MAVADQPEAAGPAPGWPAEAGAGRTAVEPDPTTLAALARAADELGRFTDREPSVGLVPAVMHAVWAELRPGHLIALPGSDGHLLVGSTAVATAITGRLDDLATLVVRRCTVESPDAGSDQPGADGAGALRVQLTAAVAYGADTGELSSVVRTTVTDTVRDLFGLDVDRVDLVVEDVFVTGAGR